jgi:hypothetical protein
LAQRLQTAGCAVDLSGEDWLTAGDLMPPPPPGAGRALGKRVPSAPRSRVQFDATYHDRGGGNGRLQIINRGTETVYDLNIDLPPEASNITVLTSELPLTKLPSGKSLNLPASRHMGPGKDHFDIHVTGHLEDGTPVEEDVFVSLTG